jgi:hypothetical protein
MPFPPLAQRALSLPRGFEEAAKFFQYKASMKRVKEKRHKMELTRESAGRSLFGARAFGRRRRREESPGSTGHGGG